MPKQPETEQVSDNSSDQREDPSAETGPASQVPFVAGRSQTDLRPPSHDRRQFTVFQVDEFVFQQATTRTTHWSVPWSDLMMTMFILFLIMFVYQTAQKQVLVGDETEVVGGETTGALEIAPNNKASIPYAPIKPGLPLITGGTIKKVVPIHIYDIDGDTRFVQDNTKNPMERIKKSLAAPSSTAMKSEQQVVSEEVLPKGKKEFLTDQETLSPQSTVLEHGAASGDEKTNKFIGTIASTIASYNLGKYASVDLVSGTDVRITLSSDLFFTAGKADLTSNSTTALQKIGAAIKNIPFMIEVIGHTDNQPLHADRFPSNWELSVARASSVARFFIEETDMKPDQFMVSGYSSYRPLYPNTTLQNRAANRRIEVIISNRYPPQIMADKK